MPTTPTYNWPYQALTDTPDGAALGQNLALAIEATVSALEPGTAPLSGSGSPESVVAAPVGSVYTDTAGADGHVLYTKKTGGITATGWVEVGAIGATGIVRAATTGNITIATALNAGDILDGVTLVAGDLALVKNQSAGAENGVYVVGVTPVRDGAYNTYNEHAGARIVVQEGTANADTLWLCTSNTGGTLNTTAIVFVSSAALAAIAANTLLGNNTGSSATPGALTVAQVKTLLAIVPADVTGLPAQLADRVALKVWGGLSYDPAPDATIYVGPFDPGAVPDGDLWWRTDTPGEAPAGNRAGPGLVGFLGNPGDLIELNPGDPFAGTVFASHSADWVGSALVVSGNDIVVDGYRINGALFFSGGTNPIVRNSIINVPDGEINGLGSSDNSSTLTVEDTTIISDVIFTALNCSQRLVATRCDISGGENGIAVVAQPGLTYADGSIISQVYIHGLSFVDIGQHVDGIQVSQHASLPTWLTIEHSRIEGALGPGGIAISASITMGQGSGSTDGFLTAKVDNNDILAGGYHMRIEFRTVDCIVTNNNFGLVDGPSGEFGLAAVSEASGVLTWTNNVDGNGDPVPDPNP